MEWKNKSETLATLGKKRFICLANKGVATVKQPLGPFFPYKLSIK